MGTALASVVVIVMAVLGGCTATTAAMVTFTPAVIPLSADDDVPNPYRGMQVYEYLTSSLPRGWPYTDFYSRNAPLAWSNLESSQGNYNFSAIDQRLANAQAHGGKFGFRIFAATTDAGGAPGPFVPKYLWDEMPDKYTYAPGPGRGTYFVPDFDDPNFMSRAIALIRALGARYSNDPRLGWIEPGFMGIDAEWHMADMPVWERTNAGANQAWTVANGEAIINTWHQGFPTTRLILSPTDFAVFDYGLSLDPRIGWRHDCLGDQTLDGAMAVNPGYLHHPDRWKTAPIMWERCTDNPRLALDQVIRYHMATGHTAGAPPLEQMTPTEQSLTREMYKLMGYRYQLNSLTLPSSLAPGHAFTAVASWSNVGLTPAYTLWTVKLQFREVSTGAVVWQGVLGLDLQTLMPTRDPAMELDTPRIFSDSLTVNPNVTNATYDVVVVITDPTNYYAPLSLANQGRQQDGSYVLGKVRVVH